MRKGITNINYNGPCVLKRLFTEKIILRFWTSLRKEWPGTVYSEGKLWKQIM